MKWRVYYGDDSTHSDQDEGKPPPLDVQVIVLEDAEHGWRTQTGSDYYVWDKRGDTAAWWGCDIFGLFEYLMNTGLVLFGKQITSKQYNEIMKRALEDPDFPKKTSYAAEERIP